MGPEKINFPTTRLGTVSRQKLFGLPPVSIPTPTAPSPSPLTAVRKAHPTLRKSFRKTLQTVSGFRVRMRTVFVPYVLLPSDQGNEERERREAGTEERTVVLCVEVENSGEAGGKVGFMVEKVDVNIGGEGAKTTLIGWGDAGSHTPEKTFPLKITPLAQVNLLYAVTFVRSPEELDAFSYAKRRSLTAPGGPGLAGELQKAVTINIFGKPYVVSTDEEEDEETSEEESEEDEESDESVEGEHTKDVAYPTATFSSRWNCVLDLSTHSFNHAQDDTDPEPSVLPEPPSPFPTYALKSAAAKTNSPHTSVLFSAASLASPPLSSGSTPDGRRHTMPTPIAGVAARSLKSVTPNRASLPFILPAEGSTSRGPSPSPGPSPAGRMQYIPPSASREYLRSPTTYAAPPPPPPPQSPPPQQFDPPVTPAYPAFPPRSELPPTPMSQGPVSQGQGTVGPSVEVRRERGSGIRPGPPPTPGPSVPASFASQQASKTSSRDVKDLTESIIVSVGLLDEFDDDGSEGKIYPQDVFTLDIFVFNQSTWVRRFEVTCPSGRNRGKGAGAGQGGPYGSLGGVMNKRVKAGPGYPGVMPLDGRVRIGPLRPSSCQSVRMDFVAISPGVHSIEALTLTDIETGYSMNLRSVMDVVVHDPND